MDGSCFVSHVWTSGEVTKSVYQEISSSLINMLHLLCFDYSYFLQWLPGVCAGCLATLRWQQDSRQLLYPRPGNKLQPACFSLRFFNQIIALLFMFISHVATHHSLCPWLISQFLSEATPKPITYLISERRDYSRNSLKAWLNKCILHSVQIKEKLKKHVRSLWQLDPIVTSPFCRVIYVMSHRGISPNEV